MVSFAAILKRTNALHVLVLVCTLSHFVPISYARAISIPKSLDDSNFAIHKKLFPGASLTAHVNLLPASKVRQAIDGRNKPPDERMMKKEKRAGQLNKEITLGESDRIRENKGK